MIRAMACVLALAATPAGALSCRMPDAGLTYDQAAASPSQYAVVVGTVDFDPKRLPEHRSGGQVQKNTAVPARVTGRALDTNGFLTPFRRDVTLDVLCFGPWCASMEPDKPYMMFLELRSDGYALTLTPCNDFAFANPDRKMLERITLCFQLGGSCARR